MARTKYNQHDGLAGKLGPVVYSRNKGGGYVKLRTKGTNPKTAAQTTARLGFRTAGKLYATLSESLQGAWTNYAQKVFNPFKKKNIGNRSGAQAMAATAATIFNAGVQGVDLTTFSPYGGSAVAGVSFNLMTMQDTPPITSVVPDIQDVANASAGYKLDGVYWDSNFVFTIDLSFLGYQSTGLGQGQFIDSKGNKYGFAVYVSEPLTFIGKRPGTQYHAMLAYSKLPVKASGIVNGAHGVRIQMDATAKIAGHKNQPAIGQIFFATIVLIAENGTATKLDGKYLTFGNAAPVIPS